MNNNNESSVKNLNLNVETLSKKGKAKIYALGTALVITATTLTGCGWVRDTGFAASNQNFNLQTRVIVRSLLDDEIKYQLEGYYYVSSTDTYFRFMGRDANGNIYRKQINKSPIVVISIEQGRNLENFMVEEQENNLTHAEPRPIVPRSR